AVFNAADEIAVEKFLNGHIRFTDIPKLCEAALQRHSPLSDDDLDNVLSADAWAREFVRRATES
ncbi:MAG: 1-deoxy-D-xylulose-5-phosphate reductoisomerase, partial [Armatimonadota bacterium]